jgi:hypothetical protein
MSNSEQAANSTLRQQKILDQLQAGARTWDQLRALTKINDDNLGVTIMELLNLRRIWATRRSNVRVYGIKRRTGLVPRFAHEQRRASDQPVEL